MFLTEERLAISFIGFQIYDFHLAKTSHRFTGHVHWAEMSGVADTLCDWQRSKACGRNIKSLRNPQHYANKR